MCLMVSNEAGSGNSCQTISVIINDIDDLEKTAILNIYPNPVSEILEVKIVDKAVGPTFLQVINSMGQTKFRQQLSIQTQLDVTDWSAGYYSLLLYSKDGAIIGRKPFVVVH